MSKESLVLWSGSLLILIPFLGIPKDWRTGLVVFLGLVLVLAGYSLRRTKYLRTIDKGNGERGSDSFVETTEKLFDEYRIK